MLLPASAGKLDPRTAGQTLLSQVVILRVSPGHTLTEGHTVVGVTSWSSTPEQLLCVEEQDICGPAQLVGCIFEG